LITGGAGGIGGLLLPALSRAKQRANAIACMNNKKQLCLAWIMYAGDNGDNFPLTPGTSWEVGPYSNAKGLPCGGEWFRSDKKTPNTPAPMLASQLPNNRVWACPKRKRGLTYTSETGEFDPSITGFLSYGFNMIGVFGRVDPANNSNLLPFKASQSEKPVVYGDVCGQ